MRSFAWLSWLFAAAQVLGASLPACSSACTAASVPLSTRCGQYCTCHCTDAACVSWREWWSRVPSEDLADPYWVGLSDRMQVACNEYEVLLQTTTCANASSIPICSTACPPCDVRSLCAEWQSLLLLWERGNLRLAPVSEVPTPPPSLTTPTASLSPSLSKITTSSPSIFARDATFSPSIHTTTVSPTSSPSTSASETTTGSPSTATTMATFTPTSTTSTQATFSPSTAQNGITSSPTLEDESSSLEETGDGSLSLRPVTDSPTSMTGSPWRPASAWTAHNQTLLAIVRRDAAAWVHERCVYSSALRLVPSLFVSGWVMAYFV